MYNSVTGATIPAENHTSSSSSSSSSPYSISSGLGAPLLRRPVFSQSNLPSDTPIQIHVFSVNAKGKSQPVRLNVHTAKAARVAVRVGEIPGGGALQNLAKADGDRAGISYSFSAGKAPYISAKSSDALYFAGGDECYPSSRPDSP